MTTSFKTAALLAALALAAPSVADAAPRPTKEDPLKGLDADAHPNDENMTPLQAVTLVSEIETVGDAFQVCNSTDELRPAILTATCNGFNLATIRMAMQLATAVVQKDGSVCAPEGGEIGVGLRAAHLNEANFDETYFNATVDYLIEHIDCSKQKAKKRPVTKPGRGAAAT